MERLIVLFVTIITWINADGNVFCISKARENNGYFSITCDQDKVEDTNCSELIINENNFGCYGPNQTINIKPEDNSSCILYDCYRKPLTHNRTLILSSPLTTRGNDTGMCTPDKHVHIYNDVASYFSCTCSYCIVYRGT